MVSAAWDGQVAGGAEMVAWRLGIRTVSADSDGPLPQLGVSGDWNLFSTGVFEQDAQLAGRTRRLPDRPHKICAVAGGVREFARAVDDPEGAFGIVQWSAGSGHEVLIGASGSGIPRRVLRDLAGLSGVRAMAGAVLTAHCARLAGGTAREDLWAAATALDTSTLFGGFRIDPSRHDTVLVRWARGEPVLIGPQPPCSR
jgi:hypothetical protein